jgi:hypothetical protein
MNSLEEINFLFSLGIMHWWLSRRLKLFQMTGKAVIKKIFSWTITASEITLLRSKLLSHYIKLLILLQLFRLLTGS